MLKLKNQGIAALNSQTLEALNSLRLYAAAGFTSVSQIETYAVGAIGGKLKARHFERHLYALDGLRMDLMPNKLTQRESKLIAAIWEAAESEENKTKGEAARAAWLEAQGVGVPSS